MAGASSILIGVGNLYRCDDGLGILVARQVGRMCPHDCAVRESSGEGTELMALWEGAENVIVVDAVRAPARAGTVFCIDAVREKVPGGLLSCSTHAFGVAGAIETSKALGTLPPCLTLYGVAGVDFGFGTTLTREVAAAGRSVAARIVDEICNGKPRVAATGTERSNA